MIVNYQKNGWEIITQQAHGLLAAQLAAHWKKTESGSRWTEFIIAVADHDDAQIELQRDDLLTDKGGPVDYRMRSFQLDHGRRTMEFAICKSRYIALLCSMHLDFTAGDPAVQTRETRQFLESQKRQRTIWRKQLGLTIHDADMDYRLLEWCDALSLLICQHDNQPESRSVEISIGPHEKHYELFQSGEAELTVHPWPFDEKQFMVRLESRVIQQLKFSSSRQFKNVLKKTAIKEKKWLIKASGNEG